MLPLEEVRLEVTRRKLRNVRVVETDLMTFAGLDVPTHGFDVIISSGVLHHVADPHAALTLLSGALASDGVLALMVYGSIGRTAPERVRSALALLSTDTDIDERMALGRSLVQRIEGSPAVRAPWDDISELDNTTFVDRYLHPQAVGFSVSRLLELLADTGLRLLRWIEPFRMGPRRSARSFRRCAGARPPPSQCDRQAHARGALLRR